MHYYYFLAIIVIIAIIAVIVRYSKETFTETDTIIAKKLLNFMLTNEPSYKEYTDFLINNANASVNIIKYSSYKKLRNIPKISEQSILQLL